MQIMYVCTGNQCRPVMAEYYTRAKLADRGIGYRLPRKQDRDLRRGQRHRRHHEAPRPQKGRLISGDYP